MARQIPFDLPHSAAMTRDDFMVTPANASAMAMIEQWPAWPSHAALVVGPAGSGKSHLAAIWQDKAKAHSVSAPTLHHDDVPAALTTKAVVIEDVHDTAIDETALFHLLNLARQDKAHVLITSRVPAKNLQLKLPDLRSRLASFPSLIISAPDDALLRAVLVKHFADRQIAIDEGLITYLVTRMPRSLGMARELVARIDKEALVAKAEITRQFAGRVLAEMTNPDLL